ncbi:MAG: biotin--[acetyl-CoA-carboxylase] ligase [Bacillota bacterium]|uniref:biotin--[acetyl-CoA-carboxylase] ligase n=1 Tax=Desulfurispora thermophila TaxID=265470 RepID=UPI000376217F|nr:biotin--[acetyl-CoA-carboxylase] ligase [Desulfurispora thermophila]
MKDHLLKLLREQSSAYVSSEQVCKSLKVSRAAVWKQIQALRAAGYEIEALPHYGYKLLAVPDRLYPAEIAWGLKTAVYGQNVHYFNRVESTNVAARDLARRGAVDGTLVVAEEQTGGRGRLERGWFSPAGGGIWCSLILRPPLLPSEVAPVTLTCAVAVRRAIQQVAGLEVQIKWPNDLLLDGRKVCGILTEMSAEMEKVNYIIIGMGLNVNIRTEQFPPELRDAATSLLACGGREYSRCRILQRYLEQMEDLVALWMTEGMEKILAEWKQYCVTLGRQVVVSTVREQFAGLALDVGSQGELIVEDRHGVRRTFWAGEVTLAGNRAV